MKDEKVLSQETLLFHKPHGGRIQIEKCGWVNTVIHDMNSMGFPVQSQKLFSAILRNRHVMDFGMELFEYGPW